MLESGRIRQESSASASCWFPFSLYLRDAICPRTSSVRPTGRAVTVCTVPNGFTPNGLSGRPRDDVGFDYCEERSVRMAESEDMVMPCSESSLWQVFFQLSTCFRQDLNLASSRTLILRDVEVCAGSPVHACPCDGHVEGQA